MPKIKTKSGKVKHYDYTKQGYKKYTAMKNQLEGTILRVGLLVVVLLRVELLNPLKLLVSLRRR
jgi:hypothetical protein